MKAVKQLGLFGSVAGLAILLSSAQAADQGQISIQGSVAPINEITVTSQSGYNALSLVAGETDKKVAVVNEKNNATDGYTVTLASANSGKLVGANVANTIDYSIKYNGLDVTLVSGEAIVTAGGVNTGASGVDNDVLVSTTAGWHNADTYSDTLTFTIANK